MKEKLIYKVELDLIKSICGLNYPKSITKTCEFLHITEEFGGDIVKEQFINKIKNKDTPTSSSEDNQL